MSNEDAIEAIENLIIKYQDSNCRELLNRIVEGLMPVVENIISRFIDDRNLYEDIKQVGSIGMLKAIERFDFTKNQNFYSYLTPMVIGEVKHFYRDQGWSMKVPRMLQELHQKIYKAIPVLSQKLGRTPNTPEIAEHLSVSAEAVIEAISLGQNYKMLSLDNPIRTKNNESSVHIEQIVGELDQDINRIEDYSEIEEVVSFLSSFEKSLIKLRYLDKLTQNEIAGVLGVSQMQVSRRLRQLEIRIKNIQEKVCS